MVYEDIDSDLEGQIEFNDKHMEVEGSVDAQGLLEHVDGSEKEPVCPVKPRMVPKKDLEGNDTRDLVQALYSQEEERSIKEWKSELKGWKWGEAVVKQQIAATIPNSLFMKIQDKGTALEIWEALQGDFQNKSQMVAVVLRQHLQQEKCAEKEDVQAHFAKLWKMWEDLAAMGHPSGEDEFYAIILESLPISFEPFISAMNATSSVLGTVLSANKLMQAFTDEYDCQNLGKSPKKEENEAFSAEDDTERKGKGRNSKRGCCYNCGKPGYRKYDCWKEGSGKEGQKPNWLKEKKKWQKERGKESSRDKEGEMDKPKIKDSAPAATSAITEDAAWMAHFSNSDEGNDNDNNIVSSTNVTLEDLFEVDKKLWREINKGKERRREYYSVSGAGNMATREIEDSSTNGWVHETTSSKFEEQDQIWDELVEGEREDFDEQVDEMGNQPIRQLTEPKPKPEKTERVDDILATEAELEEVTWLTKPQDIPNEKLLLA